MADECNEQLKCIRCTQISPGRICLRNQTLQDSNWGNSYEM